MEYLLFMLMGFHWFVPKLLALEIIRNSYYLYANARPTFSLGIPFYGLVSCYLLSIFLRFILGCTMFLLVHDYYLQLILQVLWWIYFLDLMIGASLYYFTVPIIIYIYSLISIALLGIETFDIFSVISILLIFNCIFYMYDNIAELELADIEDSNRLIFNIHLPLLIFLYISIIFHTVTVNLRRYTSI